MPAKIVVTGAGGFVGRALLESLWESSAEITAVTRTPRPLKASRVLTGPIESDRVKKAIRNADVVIHLAGTCQPKVSDTYYGANVSTAICVARASRDSNVKRIIMLSALGSDECSPNEYLNTKGRAERILVNTNIPCVVFRSAHIIGDPGEPGPYARSLLSRDGEPVKILGSGRQRVTPVYLKDVCQALTRAIESNRTGTYELAGPDEMSVDELAIMLNGRDVELNHLPNRLAMYLSRLSPSLPLPLAELMTHPCVGNSLHAVKDFGLALRSIQPVWPRNRVMTNSDSLMDISA